MAHHCICNHNNSGRWWWPEHVASRAFLASFLTFVHGSAYKGIYVYQIEKSQQRVRDFLSFSPPSYQCLLISPPHPFSLCPPTLIIFYGNCSLYFDPRLPRPSASAFLVLLRLFLFRLSRVLCRAATFSPIFPILFSFSFLFTFRLPFFLHLFLLLFVLFPFQLFLFVVPLTPAFPLAYRTRDLFVRFRSAG